MANRYVIFNFLNLISRSDVGLTSNAFMTSSFASNSGRLRNFEIETAVLCRCRVKKVVHS